MDVREKNNLSIEPNYDRNRERKSIFSLLLSIVNIDLKAFKCQLECERVSTNFPHYRRVCLTKVKENRSVPFFFFNIKAELSSLVKNRTIIDFE